MMLPFMPKPPPKEYLTPKQRAVGRALGFMATIVAIIKLGEAMDMPENPKYAELSNARAGPEDGHKGGTRNL
eukprot:CAMPEP_0115305194 /NCGR_PEP_ID=MMETSP0270-20121206/71891_1 /TAXON_ID=71861 /ORGANISM="Scrippsiella trochoidea, Strain CCMP3099" /LENGTH=71 /DNA_ID=CAMNT_0002723381 /DNA_START=11 /DNA_END=224 /DNA_ORIENTATION=+